jgi:adenylyl-sulfate kinase
MKLGFTIWLTGLSGSGKTTIALNLASRLRRTGITAKVLDGDVVRSTISQDLGFSREDREENVRRLTSLSERLSRQGLCVIVAAISPYRCGREAARSRLKTFVEVYVRCPMEILLQRDPKGLYRRALSGEVLDFTGVNAPYEEPLNPEVTIDSSCESPIDGTNKIFNKLKALDLIPNTLARTDELHSNITPNYLLLYGIGETVSGCLQTGLL